MFEISSSETIKKDLKIQEQTQESLRCLGILSWEANISFSFLHSFSIGIIS